MSDTIERPRRSVFDEELPTGTFGGRAPSAPPISREAADANRARLAEAVYRRKGGGAA